MGNHTPTFKMPDHACNSHLHIIDPAFNNDGKAEEQIGTVETYKKLANEYCIERAVFVQAKTFACDNSCLLDAIARFGQHKARGIAVANAEVTDEELQRLHEAGVRGLRFSVWNPNNAVVSFNDCTPLGERIKDMGWNVQLHMSAAQIAQNADTIWDLPCKVVIDHMGRLDPRLGLNDPAYSFICRLVDKGNAWIKLSGPYLNTTKEEPWEDADKTAIQLAKYAPQRVVWGTDYPHITEKIKPEMRVFIERLGIWLPSEKARHLALVENPKELYDFA